MHGTILQPAMIVAAGADDDNAAQITPLWLENLLITGCKAVRVLHFAEKCGDKAI